MKTEKEEMQIMMNEAVVTALDRGSVDKKYVDIGRIPFICDDIRAIHSAVKELKGMMEDNFVRKESFDPVKMIAYGLVGIIGGGIMYILLHKP